MDFAALSAIQRKRLGPFKIKVIASDPSSNNFKPTNVVYEREFGRENRAVEFGIRLGQGKVSDDLRDRIRSRLKAANSDDPWIIMTGKNGVLLALFGDQPGQVAFGAEARMRVEEGLLTKEHLSDFEETTQVFPGTAAAADSFLQVHEIAQQFAMTELPDGSFALPNGIMSSGIPPNSSASQQESPLVGGLDGMDARTGLLIGAALTGLALFLLFRTTQG